MDHLVHSLEAATWAHGMNGTVGLQQCRGGLNLDIFLLHLERHKMPTRTILSTREPGTADGYGENSPGGGGEGPAQS